MNAVDVCHAAGTHDAAKADPAKWAALPSVGMQEDGVGGAYELRNCDRCASTLAVPAAGLR